MSEMSEAVTITLAIVPWVLIMATILATLRHCTCIGPKSLSKDDVKALGTLQELYRLQEIDCNAEFFQTSEGRWMIVRKWVQLAEPVSRWGDLFEEDHSGFMLEHAKFINGVLQDFQYDVWQEYEDLAEHLPVMRVAQEWRSWAMLTLQRFRKPTVEAKADIKRRLEWVDSARNLMCTQVADLRTTSCWNHPGKKSLLILLRDEIAPLLGLVVDQWETYELQECIGERLRELKMTLEQNARSCLRLLEVVIRTDEIRLASKLTPLLEQADFEHMGEYDRDWVEVAQRVHAQLHDGGNAFWRRGKRRKARSADHDLHHDEVADESALTQQEKDALGRYMKITSPQDLGLDKEWHEVLLTRYVRLHRDLESVAASASIVRRLSRFAQLGGELFLTQALDKNHMNQILDLVQKAVVALQKSVQSLCDTAQRGWENLRALNKDSFWSTSGPVDNLRLALSAKKTLLSSSAESLSIVRDLRSRTDKAGGDKVRKENGEMQHKRELRRVTWNRKRAATGDISDTLPKVNDEGGDKNEIEKFVPDDDD